MSNKQDIKLSKFLSLVLRHKPETINIKLDENGWVSTKELISKINKHDSSFNLNLQKLKDLVDSNDKKRFALSDKFDKIRASQGHSIEIDLNIPSQKPPEKLYHGTATKFIKSIKKSGLIKGKRQHVHLSVDIVTATKVGMRHGSPVVLSIDTKKMFEDGVKFFISDNGVWLTDKVDKKYIKDYHYTS